jgi:hypothetical protein
VNNLGPSQSVENYKGLEASKLMLLSKNKTKQNKTKESKQIPHSTPSAKQIPHSTHSVLIQNI